MSSPSALIKVNYLVIRYLHFGSVRGDLQEGNGCASRCQLPLFPVPIPVSPSTKSGFLCFFGLRRPYFLAFRAQNRGFCAFFAFGTPVFRVFEHKIEVFVRFCPSEPSFSGISSTKMGFLCALDVEWCSSAGCDYSRGRCSDCGQGSGTDYNSGCGPG